MSSKEVFTFDSDELGRHAGIGGKLRSLTLGLAQIRIGYAGWHSIVQETK